MRPSIHPEHVSNTLDVLEQSLEDLQRSLNTLPAEERDEVAYVPKNIEVGLRRLHALDRDNSGSSAARINTLSEQFKELVKKFDLDPTFHELTGSIDS